MCIGTSIDTHIDMHRDIYRDMCLDMSIRMCNEPTDRWVAAPRLEMLVWMLLPQAGAIEVDHTPTGADLLYGSTGGGRCIAQTAY